MLNLSISRVTQKNEVMKPCRHYGAYFYVLCMTTLNHFMSFVRWIDHVSNPNTHPIQFSYLYLSFSSVHPIVNHFLCSLLSNLMCFLSKLVCLILMSMLEIDWANAKKDCNGKLTDPFQCLIECKSFDAEALVSFFPLFFLFKIVLSALLTI